MKRKTMERRLICLCFIHLLAVDIECVILKRGCPQEEMHKSCVFHEEYTCWVRDDKLERVKTPPKRLPHCRSGCFCRKGLVRAYPGGPCIPAAGCRNRRLQAVLRKLPKGYSLL